MTTIGARPAEHHLPASIIARFAGSNASGKALPLPTDAEATRDFARLGIPQDMWSDILHSRPDQAANAAARWLVQRAYDDVVDNLGSGANYIGWPAVPHESEATLRHVYIWALLAALPSVHQFHRSRNIPDEDSWRALQTLGTSVRESAAVFGKSGLLFGLWVPPLAFRGVHYPLGRLSFDIAGKTGRDGEVVQLFVHVPGAAKLDPTQCDRSWQAAREFTRDHFPECRVDRMVCRSWLLDQQLAQYLPATSNILSFQHRFELATSVEAEVADLEWLEYVFQRQASGAIDETLLNQLPQRTRLQRAFVDHLRSGKHWYAPIGHSQL